MAGFNYKQLRLEISESAAQRKKDNEEFLANNLQNLTGEADYTELIFDESSKEVADGFFKLTEVSYRFAKFNEVMFGQDLAERVEELLLIENIQFYFCDFTFCGFSNLRFNNCSFIGCNFSECYTMGFMNIFESCRFMNIVQGEVSIEDAPCIFKSCEFSVRFIRSDLSMAVFDHSHFYFAKFDETNLKGTIFVETSFDTVNMKDCNMRDTKILKPKVIEFYFENTAKNFKVSKHTFIDLMHFNKKEAREVRFAAETYSQLSELFEENKLMDLSGEYFYQYKLTERLMLKKFEKFKSTIGLLICGYGERPIFSLLSSLVLILTCGTLYMFFGVSVNNEILVFHPTLQHLLPPLGSLVLWYHFSLVTFSTVGYGNVVPVGGSLFVSAFEMVLGVIMVGIWVSTLVRKMVR